MTRIRRYLLGIGFGIAASGAIAILGAATANATTPTTPPTHIATTSATTPKSLNLVNKNGNPIHGNNTPVTIVDAHGNPINGTTNTKPVTTGIVNAQGNPIHGTNNSTNTFIPIKDQYGNTIPPKLNPQKTTVVGKAKAIATGFTYDASSGTYSSSVAAKNFGANNRKNTQQVIDPGTYTYTMQDPGGWQTSKYNTSYTGTHGYQNKITGPVFSAQAPTVNPSLTAGTQTKRQVVKGKVGNIATTYQTSVAHNGVFQGGATVNTIKLTKGAGLTGTIGAAGSTESNLYKSQVNGTATLGSVSATGSASLSLHGYAAQGSAALTLDGLKSAATVSGSAEVYLAKAHAEGTVQLGNSGILQHTTVGASGDASTGAKAALSANVGLTGVQVHAEAFAGAKVSGDLTGQVGGVGGDLHGEAWAGAGAEADVQAGMGADGKFHLGGSVGAAFGVGGKVGVSITVDPKEVMATISDKNVQQQAQNIVHNVQTAGQNVLNAIGQGFQNATFGAG